MNKNLGRYFERKAAPSPIRQSRSPLKKMMIASITESVLTPRLSVRKSPATRTSAHKSPIALHRLPLRKAQPTPVKKTDMVERLIA